MINQVILLGFVGQDPTIKDNDGRKVANFTMATSESYKKDGEYVNITDWHNIVFWGNVANYISGNVKKGSTVAVTGKLKTRNYTDKDGIKKYVTEVVGDKIQVIKPTNPGATTDRVDIDGQGEDDDLPF